MALPSKRRGFRTIVIDGKTYNWRLNERSGFVDVNPIGAGTQRLEIDFGWYDPYLYQPGKEKQTDFEPKIVTPKFVEGAIKFALTSGWNPESAAPTVRLIYRDEAFRVAG